MDVSTLQSYIVSFTNLAQINSTCNSRTGFDGTNHPRAPGDRGHDANPDFQTVSRGLNSLFQELEIQLPHSRYGTVMALKADPPRLSLPQHT